MRIQFHEDPVWDLQSREEVRFIVENEMIAHLDDFLLRRTKLAWIGQLSIKSITELAGILGNSLGWDNKYQQCELDRSLDILRKRHAVKI